MEYVEYSHHRTDFKKIGHCAVIEDSRLAKILSDDELQFRCDIKLFDRRTGKTYSANTWVPTEEDRPNVVMGYMMYSHYCGCHRASSVTGSYEDQCSADDDGECDCDRFLVLSSIHPDYPDINLYYETEA